MQISHTIFQKQSRYPMFEREFEFTVNQPLEVCEERILDVQKAREFPSHTISIFINTIDPNSFKVCLSYGVRKIIKIEAVITQVDDSTSSISGVASLNSDGYVLSAVMILIFIIMMLYVHVTAVLLGIALLALLGGQVALEVSTRNQLITSLEQSLNPAIQKKRE